MAKQLHGDGKTEQMREQNKSGAGERKERDAFISLFQRCPQMSPFCHSQPLSNLPARDEALKGMRRHKDLVNY